LKNAVVYPEKDGLAKYELNAEEVTFPLVLEQDGCEVVAYFLMDAQVPAHEIKSFLNDMLVRFKTNDSDEREYATGDESECMKFVAKHFRSILGISEDATVEDMKEWLGANPDTKLRIFKEGYDRILLDVDETVAKKGLSLTRKAEPGVKIKLFLYSPEKGQIEELHIKHVTRKETEEDRIRYKRAVRVAEKGKYQMSRYNLDVLEQMYGNLIQRIDGMLLDSVPCTEENREAWIPKVPILMKVYVVNRIFNRLSVKNV
jgi:hypothetical protein